MSIGGGWGQINYGIATDWCIMCSEYSKRVGDDYMLEWLIPEHIFKWGGGGRKGGK